MSDTFIVEVSARHIHLTDEDIKILFGADEKLNSVKELSQPGQFASDKKLTIVGPKNEIKNVRVLGPSRSKTQVEISMTDARSLGIDAPIRLSGDIKASAPCILVGPNGKIELKEGVIVAKRHIHLTPEKAAEYGVKDDDTVWVRINSDSRTTIFGDVCIRISEKFSNAMHVDTDEANAASIGFEAVGEIVKV